MVCHPLLPVPHAFTGVEDGDFRPGSPTVARSSEALVRRLGGEGRLGVVSQVHGRRVAREAGGEADALLTTTPGQVVAVRVADCVPILLWAPGGVVAVHAGWRGTAQDIVRASLAALREATGCQVDQVKAVVGPAICGGCYEVGEEVIAGVSAVAPGNAWRSGQNVDLRLANAEILRTEGVEVAQIAACTRCSLDGEERPLYWSHRRDGDAGGRQVGAILCC